MDVSCCTKKAGKVGILSVIHVVHGLKEVYTDSCLLDRVANDSLMRLVLPLFRTKRGEKRVMRIKDQILQDLTLTPRCELKCTAKCY